MRLLFTPFTGKTPLRSGKSDRSFILTCGTRLDYSFRPSEKSGGKRTNQIRSFEGDVGRYRNRLQRWIQRELSTLKCIEISTKDNAANKRPEKVATLFIERKKTLINLPKYSNTLHSVCRANVQGSTTLVHRILSIDGWVIVGGHVEM